MDGVVPFPVLTMFVMEAVFPSPRVMFPPECMMRLVEVTSQFNLSVLVASASAPVAAAR